MSAYIEYDDNLDERRMDAPGSVLSKPAHQIIKYAILPRKILVKNTAGILRILVNNGEIASYQKPEASEPTWVNPPVSNAEQKTLDELEALAGDALENGTLTIAMLDDQERDTLKKHLPPVVKPASSDGQETAEVVFLDERRAMGKEVKGESIPAKNTPPKVESETLKPAAGGSSVIRTFFDSINSKVRFAYYVDGLSGKTAVSGISGGLNESVCESVKIALESWNKTVSDVLSDAPKMIVTGAASRGDAVLVMVSDSNYCVIAEAEMQKFGMLVGLWDKARKTKSDAT